MSPLRRTGDWPRKKPLRSSKPPLPRRSGMSGVSSGLSVGRQPLKPSRPKVTAEERRGRKLLAARSGGRCEIGGTCPAQEAHHRKNRSQGGTWDVENLLHLCAPHHQYVTTNPAVARQQGWAVLSTHDPARVPVWLAGRGWHYLTADGCTVPTERSAA